MGNVGIIGGSAALAHAGWTTQFQQMPDIIMSDVSPEALIPGARLHRRDAATYRILEGHSEAGPGGEWGCRMLDPVYAIADAWLDRARGGSTHIYDPDDIDPECDDFIGELRLALMELGGSESEIAQCIEHFSAVNQGLGFNSP